MDDRKMCFLLCLIERMEKAVAYSHSNQSLPPFWQAWNPFHFHSIGLLLLVAGEVRRGIGIPILSAIPKFHTIPNVSVGELGKLGQKTKIHYYGYGFPGEFGAYFPLQYSCLQSHSITFS